MVARDPPNMEVIKDRGNFFNLTLGLILNKYYVRVRAEFIRLGVETSSGLANKFF
jgi:hypothetical protein